MANNTQIIPPPFKGQNDQFPLIALSSPFAESMSNFNNLKGVVKLRQGNRRLGDLTTSLAARTIAPYGTSKLIAVIWSGTTDFYEVQTGTPTLVRTEPSGSPFLEMTYMYFRGYLFFCMPAMNTQFFTGAAWGTAAYTGMTIVRAGCVHKNRAYFIGAGTSIYGYSEIDSIAGALTPVDLRSVISSDAELYIIASVAMGENVNQENVLAFVFSNGDILYYSGSYPNSTSWQLISRAKVAPVLGPKAWVAAKGDTLIFTTTGVLSLRNILISGATKEVNEGIGAAIKNRWVSIVAYATAQGVSLKFNLSGIYDEDNDRFFVLFPVNVDYSTGAGSLKPSQLIFDFTLGAWYEYFQTVVTTARSVAGCYYSGKAYIITSEVAFSGSPNPTFVVQFEGKTTFLDDKLTVASSDTEAINYNLITAPLPIPKYGSNSIDGVEIIAKSDLYPQTNYSFIADLGRQETSGQPLVAQGTSIARPMANVGIQGAITSQLRVSGSSVSASIGLELYGFNVWYSMGEQGSR